jgi:hypothetical protein
MNLQQIWDLIEAASDSDDEERQNGNDDGGQHGPAQAKFGQFAICPLTGCPAASLTRLFRLIDSRLYVQPPSSLIITMAAPEYPRQM